MPYTRVEIAKHAKKLGRSARTLRRWVARGANLDDPESIRKFLAESEHKKTNIRRFLEARGLTTARPKAERARKPRDPGASSSHGNGEQRHLAGAVLNTLWRVWNSRKKNRSGGCKPRCELGTRFRLRPVRIFG